MINFLKEQPLTRENILLSQVLDTFFDTAVLVDEHGTIINYGTSSTQLFSNRLSEYLNQNIRDFDQDTPFPQVLSDHKDILYRSCILNGHPAIQNLYAIFMCGQFRGVLAVSSYTNIDLLKDQLLSPRPILTQTPSLFEKKAQPENPLTLSRTELLHETDTLGPLVDAFFDSAIYISDHLKVLRCGMGSLKLTDDQIREMIDAESIKQFDPDSPYEYVLETGHTIAGALSIVLGRQCLNSIFPVFYNDQIIAVIGGIQFSGIDMIKKQLCSNEKTGLPNDDIDARLHKNHVFEDYIGSCPVTRDLISTCQKYASASYPILLLGESGTGKEILAGAIHSAKTEHIFKPYVKINCSAIPNDLLESELFGHEKGAFTGATGTKKGKFEVASGGTILLDEIGDMDLRLQSKLLRVLEEKVFERVGGTKEIPLNARIIAATNCNLYEKCMKNQFRLDLYYRLNTLEIQVPPLRKRREDIPELVSYFLIKNGANIGIRPDAMKVLTDYSWPGNVRELRNVINRICILHEKESVSADIILQYLHPDHDFADAASFAPAMPNAAPDPEPAVVPELCSLEEAEEKMIRATLAHEHNNINRAAVSLGITRATLYNKMKKYHIERE